MNQKSAIQKSPEDNTPASSSGASDETVSTAIKAAKPKKAVSTKAVPAKTIAKPKAATSPAAKPSSKIEKVVKAAEDKKTPTKTSPAEVKAEAVVPPKANKVVKGKKHEPKKPKLVRDSFTIPENDYALFAVLKQRALAAGIEIKKGELLRAGIVILNSLSDIEFASAIGSVERIKTGRPKK